MSVLKEIASRQGVIKSKIAWHTDEVAKHHEAIQTFNDELADLLVAERVLLRLVSPPVPSASLALPPKMAPRATLIRPQQQSHDQAMVTDKLLWERFAGYLNDHCVWPGIKEIERVTGIKSVYMRFSRLERAGYVCRAGRNGALWWCKKWPEGMAQIEPPPMEMPPDTAPMIGESEPDEQPAAIMSSFQEDKLAGSCTFGDCRYPKQPGRDMCSVHLHKKMPPRQRANEV